MEMYQFSFDYSIEMFYSKIGQWSTKYIPVDCESKYIPVIYSLRVKNCEIDKKRKKIGSERFNLKIKPLGRYCISTKRDNFILN